MEVRTGPVSDLSYIPAAHQTTIPNTVTFTLAVWRSEQAQCLAKAPFLLLTKQQS
ncbi:hypothetical protein DPMN_037381 [Dreissena polymorpha]|uniref:Uncharacterized protein n=1 Tax=Dreissena polymorpha TaxID=45954 RepID=A0A9D4RMS5_DREPO|nr:hypothetical protein DPMN_037381 [Dreissena polymorpha]